MIENNIIPRGIDAITGNNRNPEPASDTYTLIEIDNKTFALNTQNVLEIVKIMELDYPNRMLSCVLGIIKYEQEPVGVIDLREVFKKERIVYDLSAKIIILKSEDATAAIVCDKVSDIKKLEKEKIHSIPYQCDSVFYEGIYSQGENNIYIMNIKGIIEYINSNPEKFINDKDECSKYIADDDISREILKERKESFFVTDGEIQSNVSLYDSGVSFKINGIKYYINMASVKEFYKVKDSKFIKVPCTQDYIFGLINIKGDYITVIDIRRLHNCSKTEVKEKSTIIILNSEEYKIGILADEICASMIVDFDAIIQNKLQKQEDNKMPEFVQDDEIYQVLDIDQLLKDERLTIC